MKAAIFKLLLEMVFNFHWLPSKHNVWHRCQFWSPSLCGLHFPCLWARDEECGTKTFSRTPELLRVPPCLFEHRINTIPFSLGGHDYGKHRTRYSSWRRHKKRQKKSCKRNWCQDFYFSLLLHAQARACRDL